MMRHHYIKSKKKASPKGKAYSYIKAIQKLLLHIAFNIVVVRAVALESGTVEFLLC